jgi:hypothetical protein
MSFLLSVLCVYASASRNRLLLQLCIHLSTAEIPVMLAGVALFDAAFDRVANAGAGFFIFGGVITALADSVALVSMLSRRTDIKIEDHLIGRRRGNGAAGAGPDSAQDEEGGDANHPAFVQGGYQTIG